MKTGRLALAALLLSFGAPPRTRAQQQEPIRPFDLVTISRLGEEIHRVDGYAARATDIVFAQGLDLSSYPIVGWVVTHVENTRLVLFIGEYEEGLRGVFEVRPDETADATFKSADRRELTAEEQHRFAARQTAIAATEHRCSQRYNTVVLPDPQSDSWLVYVLSATTQPGEIVVGGHYRHTVASDGSTVERSDRLYRACLRIPPPSAAVPQGDRVVMPAMTHLVSDTPLETHVFLSLLHDTDLAVGTGDRVIWKVSGTSITPMER